MSATRQNKSKQQEAQQVATGKRQSKRPTKGQANQPEEADPITGGCAVTVKRSGALGVQLVEGTRLREVPTLLRQAAKHVEDQLVG